MNQSHVTYIKFKGCETLRSNHSIKTRHAHIVPNFLKFMSLSKKLAFHVKQLGNSLDIRNEGDSSLDKLIESLTSTYQEYRLEPKHLFRAEVQTALKEYVAKLPENSKVSRILYFDSLRKASHTFVSCKLSLL